MQTRGYTDANADRICTKNNMSPHPMVNIIKAHEAWALSSSWAFFNKVPDGPPSLVDKRVDS